MTADLSSRNNATSLSVISGRYKGTRLLSPHSSATHPMGAREKNALFNTLRPWLAGATVLDAYAGSGALGIEALSRGAASITFVENDRRAVQSVRRNLKTVTQVIAKSPDSAENDNFDAKNFPEITLLPEDIAKTTQNPAFHGVFSLILADPPYDGFNISEVAKLANLLQSGGILALSFPYRQGIPEIVNLNLLTARKYAAAGVAIYQKP